MKEIKEDSVAVPSAIKDKGSNIKSLWSHNPLSQVSVKIFQAIFFVFNMGLYYVLHCRPAWGDL